MARVTLDELRTRRPVIDREKMAATTEDDIHRHALEDGEPGDVDLTDGVLVVPSTRLRRRLGMSQAVFAQVIGVPLETVQDWEKKRTLHDPAARTLLALVAADPRHVLGLLGWAERDDIPQEDLPKENMPQAVVETQPSSKGQAIGRWVRRDVGSKPVTTTKRRA